MDTNAGERAIAQVTSRKDFAGSDGGTRRY
jgi:hypothetical protein